MNDNDSNSNSNYRPVGLQCVAEESGPSQKDTQSWNKWRRKIKGGTGPDSPVKMAIKMVPVAYE